MELSAFDGIAWVTGPLRVRKDGTWTPVESAFVWDGTAWVAQTLPDPGVSLPNEAWLPYTPGVSEDHRGGLRIAGLARALSPADEGGSYTNNPPTNLQAAFRHTAGTGTDRRVEYEIIVDRHEDSDFYIDLMTDYPVIQDEWRTNVSALRLEMLGGSVYWSVYDETGGSVWGDWHGTFAETSAIRVEIDETTVSAWVNGNLVVDGETIHTGSRDPDINVFLGVGEAQPGAEAKIQMFLAKAIGDVEVSLETLPQGQVQPSPTSLRALMPSPIRVGTAVSAVPLAMDPTYGEVLAREYNEITIENALKFQFVQPQQGVFSFEEADFIIDFAESHGMTIHGHALLWSEATPQWLLDGNFTATEIEAILREHVSTVVGRYKGRMRSWDVINEPFVDFTEVHRPTVWYQALGVNYIKIALEEAHAADPNALLYINEWGCELVGDKRDAMAALLQDLVNQGVPIHGVGLQMHENMNATYNQVVNEPVVTDGVFAGAIAQYQAIGVKVRISELDINNHDDSVPGWQDAQGYWFGKFLEVAIQAGVETFGTWGFTDRHSSLQGWYTAREFGNGLVFDEDYAPKPGYTEMIGVLQNGGA